MPLDDLFELVATLRARIDEHSSRLQKSETLTRYALIDPMLRGLGWDTSDPAQVIPEYPSSGGRADYALMANGTPSMMLEAKKLGEQLQGAVSQGISYCIERGTPYFTVTDGQTWEVYETHKPVPVQQKLVVRFDLRADPASEVSLKALVLWRQSALEGTVREGEPAFVDSPEGPVVDVPPERPKPPTPPDPGKGWVPLQRLKAQGSIPTGSRIHLPDGETADLKAWADIPGNALRWLNTEGHFTEQQCPIPSGTKRYLVATRPIHLSGSQFRNPGKAGNLWIERNYNATDQVKNALLIIERAGMDPAGFSVRLGG